LRSKETAGTVEGGDMYRIEARRYSRMLAVVLAVAALPAVAAVTATHSRGVGVTATSTPSAEQSADDTPWPIAARPH
jgi:Na+/alanine symporter